MVRTSAFFAFSLSLPIVIGILLLLVSCQRVEFFSLEIPQIKGDVFRISEIENHKATVLVFLSPECPLSQKYTLPLKEIKTKYAEENFLFLAVFQKSYSEAEIENFGKEYELDMPMLVDKDYSLTHFLYATITPEVFVLNEHGQTLYSGKIDNWFEELGVKREVVTEKYLDDALNAIATGTEIKIPKTKAVGCFIE